MILLLAFVAPWPERLFAAPISSERPNIISVLANDLSDRDIGFFDQRQFQTPNIDCLAREGLARAHSLFSVTQNLTF